MAGKPRKLSKTEVKGHTQTVELPEGKVNVSSLDTERSWVVVECSKGHEATVEDHPGGSRATCDKCGERFDYGGYDHERAMRETFRAGMDGAPQTDAKQLTAGDTAASTDK